MQRFARALFALAIFGTIMVARPTTVGAYARCNCTAYAQARRPDLPMSLGNARTWGIRAKKLGFPVDSKPRVGDVIVLQPGVQGAHRVYGHVAYVVAVNGNRVTVREMNGGRGCGVVRDTFRVGRGVTFIHRKSYKAPKPPVKTPAPTKPEKGQPEIKDTESSK